MEAASLNGIHTKRSYNPHGPRILWSEAEQTLVLETAIKHGRDNPTNSLTAIVKHAQQCLPRERQRTILGYKQFGKWQELETALRSPAQPPPPPAPPEFLNINFVQPPSAEILHSLSNEVILGELLTRLVKEVSEKMNEILLQTLSRISFSAGVQGPAPAEPSVRKKRVAIIGLLREQYLHVLGRINVPKTFELVFYDKDKSPHLPPVDYAILQKHISHSWDDQAKKFAGRFWFVDGGVNAVAEQCRRIFELGVTA